MSARRALAVATGAALLAVTGCSKQAAESTLPEGPAGSAPPASSDPASTAAAAPGAERAAVVAGYLAYWQALLHAHAAGNPGDPLLAAHAGGPALVAATASIRDNVQRGLRLRGNVGHTPVAQVTSPTAATLRDCLDLRHWLAYSARTGKRDKSVGTQNQITARYTLTRAGTTWIVVTVVEGTSC